MQILGVDGCKDGWFWIKISKDDYKFGIAKTVQELLLLSADIILIDMPIGLIESGGNGRLCDTLARKYLGARRSSVFSAPCRSAIYASSYTKANQINRAKAGRGLSKQSWNISNKIKEIDVLLFENDEAKSKLHEVHPEIVFWAMNGRKPMQHNKKKSAGEQERLSLLQAIWPQTTKLYMEARQTYLRKQVAHDDILDALAIAILGFLKYKSLQSIPAQPETDLRGLPMQMLFADFDNTIDSVELDQPQNRMRT